MTNSTIQVRIERLRQAAVSEAAEDCLAVEEPLEIRVGGKSLSVTMRTPGNDFQLAVGFLFSEGILTGASQIAGISCAPDNPNIVMVTLADQQRTKPISIQRAFVMTSACGLCGKASLAALASNHCPTLPPRVSTFDSRILYTMPDSLRRRQSVFDSTGGLHAAALFNASGELESLQEDVGRHNAVDKLIGDAVLRERTPLAHSIVMVSGRASYELVQKCLMGGVPVLAAVGAPSSLAVTTAARCGMTLLGFLREGRFNVYSEPGRLY